MSTNWKQERVCLYCSIPFIPSYKPQQFCSRKCGALNKAEIKFDLKPILQCSWCQKDIKGRNETQTNELNNFCNRECNLLFLRGGKTEEEYLKKVCEACNKEYQTTSKHRETSRFCSKSCSKSKENHPYWEKEGPTKGMTPWLKGLTKETDERVAKMAENVSKTHKQQFAEGLRSNKGENNPNFGITRDLRTEEQLENYSKAAIKRVLDGKSCNHSFFKRGYFDSKKANKKFFYRSSYEERMMFCLELDKEVFTYEHEPFYIKTTTGKRYLPDFLVHYKTGKIILLELKNDWNKFTEEMNIKQNAAEIYCKERGWQYLIWCNKEIKELEKQLKLC